MNPYRNNNMHIAENCWLIFNVPSVHALRDNIQYLSNRMEP